MINPPPPAFSLQVVGSIKTAHKEENSLPHPITTYMHQATTLTGVHRRTRFQATQPPYCCEYPIG